MILMHMRCGDWPSPLRPVSAAFGAGLGQDFAAWVADEGLSGRA
jgi:hypothetical protein